MLIYFLFTHFGRTNYAIWPKSLKKLIHFNNLAQMVLESLLILVKHCCHCQYHRLLPLSLPSSVSCGLFSNIYLAILGCGDELCWFGCVAVALIDIDVYSTIFR